MTCVEFLRLLDADEGWDGGDAAAHAAACTSCGAAARRMGAAAAAFRAMREDDSPPFLHTRVLAHVRAEAGRAPWWRSAPAFRAAWAGPLFVVAVIVVLGGYGLRESLEPQRKPVPQSALAKPDELALGEKSKAMDSRIQTPVVELPEVGATRQESEQPMPSAPGKGGADKDNYAPEPGRGDAPVTGTLEKKSIAESRETLGWTKAQPPAPAVASASPPAGAPRPAAGSEAGGAAPALAAPAPLPDQKGNLSLAAKEEARERRVQTADELAPAEAPKRYILVDLVGCTLKTEDGQEYVILNLPQVQAPPPGVEWAVTVKRDGVVEVRDASGSWLKEATEALQARASELNLLPGKYSLGRVGH